MSFKPLHGYLVAEIDNEKYACKPFSFFGEGFKTVPYNEVLAYKLTLYYGFDFIPFTGINEVPELGKGSFQEFIKNALPLTLVIPKNKRAITEIILMDILFCNTDRKTDSIFMDGEGKLYAIDYGFSLGFHALSERAKRPKDYHWNIHPYALGEGADLEISKVLLDMVDLNYLNELIEKIQGLPFTYATKDYTDYDDECLWKETKEILRWRIDNLPALTFDQFRGIR